MKHDRRLAVGFKWLASSAGITQEKFFIRIQFFIIFFFIILFSITLSDPYRLLSLIDDASAESLKEVIVGIAG